MKIDKKDKEFIMHDISMIGLDTGSKLDDVRRVMLKYSGQNYHENVTNKISAISSAFGDLYTFVERLEDE